MNVIRKLLNRPHDVKQGGVEIFVDIFVDHLIIAFQRRDGFAIYAPMVKKRIYEPPSGSSQADGIVSLRSHRNRRGK